MPLGLSEGWAISTLLRPMQSFLTSWHQKGLVDRVQNVTGFLSSYIPPFCLLYTNTVWGQNHTGWCFSYSLGICLCAWYFVLSHLNNSHYHKTMLHLYDTNYLAAFTWAAQVCFFHYLVFWPIMTDLFILALFPSWSDLVKIQISVKNIRFGLPVSTAFLVWQVYGEVLGITKINGYHLANYRKWVGDLISVMQNLYNFSRVLN